MFCNKCGKNIGDAKFCAYCGTPATNLQQGAEANSQQRTVNMNNTTASSGTPDLFALVKTKFQELTGGNNKNVNFKLADMVNDVFNQHPKGEAERVLTLGSRFKRLTNEQLLQNYTKPWVYSRVFFLLLITSATLALLLGLFALTRCTAGLIFIGSATVPFALLILFYELNIERNIGFIDIIVYFFIGALLSFFCVALIGGGDLSFFGAFLIGITEELAKLIPIVIFMNQLKTKHILSGILVGAAVGTGFAVFESAGYALENLDASDPIASAGLLILIRGVLAPGMHIAWSAITGAAVALGNKNSGLWYDFMTSIKFWVLLVISITLHAVWDMEIASGWIKLIILTVISWVFILPLIKSGMREILSKLHKS